MKKNKDYIKSSSLYTESINSIKANILFSDDRSKVISIASPTSNKENVKFLYSLGKSFAKDGYKIGILDFDLRIPILGEFLKIENSKGTSNFINEDLKLDDLLIKDKNEDNLFILPAGNRLENPSKALMSNKAKQIIKEVEKKFDYVFINTPPVNLLADGAIVSTYCDGVILSIKAYDTKEDEVENSIENLKKVKANIIGLVLTNENLNR